MDVFCCCHRGHRQSSKAKTKLPSASTPSAPPVLPSPPAPVILPALLSQIPAPSANPLTQTPNLSRSSLPLAAPIPGAPLEPVEISELVIDDSDSGRGSPRGKKNSSNNRMSRNSTMEFVRTRLRRHMSQDTLQRHSKNTVGSSTEELARRAELRRLMRKRIQEELQGDEHPQVATARQGSSTAARVSMPLIDGLPNGGPRDHIEFSVMVAAEDIQNTGASAEVELAVETPSPKLSGNNHSIVSPSLENKPAKLADPRRVSCPPGYLGLGQGTSGMSPTPASRSALRDKRNSLPTQLSSSSDQSSPISFPSMTESSPDSFQVSSGSGQLGTGRKAVTAVVVNGGFTAKDFKKKGNRAGERDSYSLHTSPQSPTAGKSFEALSKSPMRQSVSLDIQDPTCSPLNVWLRAQEHSLAASISDDGNGFRDSLDGACVFETPKADKPGPSPSPSYSPKVGNGLDELNPQGAHLHSMDINKVDVQGVNTVISDPATRPVGCPTSLRGGSLDEGDLSSENSPHAPQGSGSDVNSERFKVPFNRYSLPGIQSPSHKKSHHRPSKSTGNLAKNPRFSRRLLSPDVIWSSGSSQNREVTKPTQDSYGTARNSTMSLNLPLPGLRKACYESSSGVASETSSFQHREAELLTIPKRFGDVAARWKPHAVSRFREELEEADLDPSSRRRPSFLSKIHLAIPKKVRLASKSHPCQDVINSNEEARLGNGFSSLRGVPSPMLSLNPVQSNNCPSLDRQRHSQAESAEDAWRRAIRAEAEERSSIAHRSSGRHSLSIRRSVSRPEHDSEPRLTDFANQRHHYHGTNLSSASHECVYSVDHPDLSPLSMPPKQYNEKFRRNLQHSDRILEDWSRRQRADNHAARLDSSPLPARRLSEAPQSWAKFPSCNRAQRNGPAGPGDGVNARDFAVTSVASDGKMEWVTDKPAGPVTPKKRAATGPDPRRLSNNWAKALRFSLGKLFCPRVPRSVERHASAKGCRRSSCQTGGCLEYPELEILPTEGGFKELRALEHEIESMKGHARHDRQSSSSHGPSGGGDEGVVEDRLSVFSTKMASMLHEAGHLSSERDGESEKGLPCGDGLPAEGTARHKNDEPPMTPICIPSGCYHHLPPGKEACEAVGLGNTPSETFATPKSHMSSSHRKDRIEALDGPADSDSRSDSIKSCVTVINTAAKSAVEPEPAQVQLGPG